MDKPQWRDIIRCVAGWLTLLAMLVLIIVLVVNWSLPYTRQVSNHEVLLGHGRLLLAAALPAPSLHPPGDYPIESVQKLVREELEHGAASDMKLNGSAWRLAWKTQGQYWGLSIPLWMLLLPLAGLSIGLRPWARRFGDGRCRKCGYDLRGHAAGSLCPECGRSSSRC
jgi:hypothetical protein